MDVIRKSSHLISGASYDGQNLGLPTRGTTQDLCAGLCVSNTKCDAWEYEPNGTCNLKTLGTDIHNLIAQGQERITIKTSPKVGVVAGRIQYEKRGNVFHTVIWILVGVIAILFILWLMKDCKRNN